MFYSENHVVRTLTSHVHNYDTMRSTVCFHGYVVWNLIHVDGKTNMSYDRVLFTAYGAIN